jgi:hypothetical protein
MAACKVDPNQIFSIIASFYLTVDSPQIRNPPDPGKGFASSSGSRQTRRFEDLYYIRTACNRFAKKNRCGSASVAAKPSL